MAFKFAEKKQARIELHTNFISVFQLFSLYRAWLVEIIVRNYHTKIDPFY